MVLSDRDSLCPKLLVTGWAIMECALFGGLLYGWSSLNFVLKTEGIYAELCPTNMIENNTASMLNSSQHPQHSSKEAYTYDINKGCKPQDSKMALCFTIGTAFFCFGCAGLGHVNYKYGTRVTRIISFLAFELGSLMTAFISKENPWLMFPGQVGLAVGGLPLLVTNVQVSNLFVKSRSSVVGLMSGALNTSSAVMQVVKFATENGFSRQNMFFVIAALHLLVLVSTFFFLPKKCIEKRQCKQDIALEMTNKFIIDCQQIDTSTGSTGNAETLGSCIKNPMMFTHIVWLSLLKLRLDYFIGTLNPYLNRILQGDRAEVSYFTDVCYIIMMCGIMASLLSGIVYDWQKNVLKEGKSERYRKVVPAVVPLGITSLLAVSLSVLVLIPNPILLYVTFIIMTLYRSFLYCLGSAFIGEVFPGEYFGMLYGIMITCGGIVGFLQYAFFTWAEAYIGGALHYGILSYGNSIPWDPYVEALTVKFQFSCRTQRNNLEVQAFIHPDKKVVTQDTKSTKTSFFRAHTKDEYKKDYNNIDKRNHVTIVFIQSDCLLLGLVLLSFIHPAYLLISSWKDERKLRSK